jgi:hypothetical protein
VVTCARVADTLGHVTQAADQNHSRNPSQHGSFEIVTTILSRFGNQKLPDHQQHLLW